MGHFLRLISIVAFLLSMGIGIFLGFYLKTDDFNFLICFATIIGTLVFSFILYFVGNKLDKKRASKENTTTISVQESLNPLNQTAVIDNSFPSKNEDFESFIDEIERTSTSDLKIILNDQVDLYTPNELKYIEEEVKRRSLIDKSYLAKQENDLK